MPLSTDNAKAVDSIIDMTLHYKKAGIVDKPGGITSEQFNVQLAKWYLHGNPDLRIGNAELTHVTEVVAGTLLLGDRVALAHLLKTRDGRKGPITISDLNRAGKLLAIAGSSHDLGKHQNGELRMTQDWTLEATPFFNSTGIDLVVEKGRTFKETVVQITFDEVPRLKGETLEQAAARLDLDVSFLELIQKKNGLKSLDEAANLLKNLPFFEKMGFLISILGHHDALSVYNYITKDLVESRVITEKDAELIWEAIELHALISSWVGKNSLGMFKGMGLKTAIFDNPKYKRFLELFLKGGEVTINGKTHRLEKGLAALQLEGVDIFNSKDPVIVQALKELRAEFENFNPLAQALLGGDHFGQRDPSKYIGILKTVPQNANASWHDLFYGPSRTDSIEGVLLTHRDEIRMVSPEFHGKTGPEFNVALNWIRQTDPNKPGLANAILKNPDLAQDYKTFVNAWNYNKENPDSILRYMFPETFEWKDPFLDWMRYRDINVDGKPSEVFGKVHTAVDKAWYEFSVVNKAEYNKLVAQESARMKADAKRKATEDGKIIQFPTATQRPQSNPSIETPEVRSAARRKRPTTIPPGGNKPD